jgi:hypothetical protein
MRGNRDPALPASGRPFMVPARQLIGASPPVRMRRRLSPARDDGPRRRSELPICAQATRTERTHQHQPDEPASAHRSAHMRSGRSTHRSPVRSGSEGPGRPSLCTPWRYEKRFSDVDMRSGTNCGRSVVLRPLTDGPVAANCFW